MAGAIIALAGQQWGTRRENRTRAGELLLEQCAQLIALSHDFRNRAWEETVLGQEGRVDGWDLSNHRLAMARSRSFARTPRSSQRSRSCMNLGLLTAVTSGAETSATMNLALFENVTRSLSETSLRRALMWFGGDWERSDDARRGELEPVDRVHCSSCRSDHKFASAELRTMAWWAQERWLDMSAESAHLEERKRHCTDPESSRSALTMGESTHRHG
jgi:hypothetical protein